jgi:hypothetical protein
MYNLGFVVERDLIRQRKIVGDGLDVADPQESPLHRADKQREKVDMPLELRLEKLEGVHGNAGDEGDVLELVLSPAQCIDYVDRLT